MTDQAAPAVAAAAAAAVGIDAREIDTHVARVIQVEHAKTNTLVLTRGIINASRILGDRRELAPGVSVSTTFAAIDDFQSMLVACFHSNWNLPGIIMRYAIGLCIAPNHPHLPGIAIKLARHLRRTFDPLLDPPLLVGRCLAACAALGDSPSLAKRGSFCAISSARHYDHFLNDARGSAFYAAAVREARGRLHAATSGHLNDADICVIELEAEAASGSQKELAAFLDQANKSQNEVGALPVACKERILLGQLDVASDVWMVAIPTARRLMTPPEMREVAAGYFFLPISCMAPVVGSEIILPSTEYNPITVDLYGDALMDLPAHGDAHWRVQHDATADAFRDQCVHDIGIDVCGEVDELFRQEEAFGSDEMGQRALDRLLSSSLTVMTLKSYAGKLSHFAEFCHHSEIISPLEFDSDNETGVLYRALIDSLTPVDREVTTDITLATYFADFSDFKSKLIKKLHGCATFHSLIHMHVKNLKIAPSNPYMARNSVDLASKIVRAFQLLPEADRLNESAMVGLILSQLPEQTNARVEAAAMVAREELTTLDTLRRHLEAVDAEFAAMAVAAKRRANGLWLGH
eukprot:jgi/Tetstr1/441223/TSEL_029479.t1